MSITSVISSVLRPIPTCSDAAVNVSTALIASSFVGAPDEVAWWCRSGREEKRRVIGGEEENVNDKGSGVADYIFREKWRAHLRTGGVDSASGNAKGTIVSYNTHTQFSFSLLPSPPPLSEINVAVSLREGKHNSETLAKKNVPRNKATCMIVDHKSTPQLKSHTIYRT